MRTNQFDVTVAVNGRNLGTFDKMSGGAGGSEETKYRPGGMGPEKSYGGRTTRDNITISRVYDQDRNDMVTLRWLDGLRGKAVVSVSRQPLDKEGNRFGKPDVYNGILLSCTPPEHDSNGSDPAMFELTISTFGEIG